MAVTVNIQVIAIASDETDWVKVQTWANSVTPAEAAAKEVETDFNHGLRRATVTFIESSAYILGL